MGKSCVTYLLTNYYYYSYIFVGEGGESVHLRAEEKGPADKSIQEFGFNMVVSDKISMTRNIPDTRLEEYVYFVSF